MLWHYCFYLQERLAESRRTEVEKHSLVNKRLRFGLA